MKDSSNPTGGGLSSDPGNGARSETGDLDGGRALTSSCSLETAASPTASASVEPPDRSPQQGKGTRPPGYSGLWSCGKMALHRSWMAELGPTHQV